MDESEEPSRQLHTEDARYWIVSMRFVREDAVIDLQERTLNGREVASAGFGHEEASRRVTVVNWHGGSAEAVFVRPWDREAFRSFSLDLFAALSREDKLGFSSVKRAVEELSETHGVRLEEMQTLEWSQEDMWPGPSHEPKRASDELRRLLQKDDRRNVPNDT